MQTTNIAVKDGKTLIGEFTIPNPKTWGDNVKHFGAANCLVILKLGIERYYRNKGRQMLKQGKTVDEIQALFDSKDWLPPGRQPSTEAQKLADKLKSLPEDVQAAFKAMWEVDHPPKVKIEKKLVQKYMDATAINAMKIIGLMGDEEYMAFQQIFHDRIQARKDAREQRELLPPPQPPTPGE